MGNKVLKRDLSDMEKVPASPVSMFLCFQILTSGVKGVRA